MMPAANINSPTSLELHSCTLCRQRKVKCDRQQPCSSCAKARVKCIPLVPAPPRRRKAKETLYKEDLLHRLKRYETLLKSYGAKIEELEGHDADSLGSTASTNCPVDQGPASSSQKAVLITQVGRVRSLEHNLWTNLSDEILESPSEDDSANATLDISEIPPITEVGSFIFEPSPNYTTLTHLHPPTALIFTLWQKFLDNVNPLIKVIHVPTVQQQILQASLSLDQVSRPMEALMFAMYSCTITTLSNDECEALTGESKATLLPKYNNVAQQALMCAGLFKTLDFVVLQADILFLTAIHPVSSPGEFWIHTGVARRIAQRMGLHRESVLAKLPVLEAEIRRRLWWQINILDSRSADRAAVGVPPNRVLWETAMPLNVNDSDLTPDMTAPPLNHVGATEMTFVLQMYELVTFIRHSKSMAPFEGSWQKLTSHTVPLASKDKIIDELYDLLERKFLRHHDPVIPLHMLARSVAILITNRMRLTTRHPRQFPDRGANMPQEEKDKLFTICLEMIEQDIFHYATPCFRRFLWRLDMHTELDALVYVLSELQHQGTGPVVDKAWSLIAQTYRYHPDMVTKTNDRLFMAVGNLTLRSWGVRDAECRKHNIDPPEGSPPLFITLLRTQRTTSVSDASPSSSFENVISKAESETAHGDSDRVLVDGNGSFDPTLMSDTLPTDLYSMDWNYWDDLM